MNQKEIKPWPEDWIEHVIQSNRLYFDGYKSIEVVQTSIRSETFVSTPMLDILNQNSSYNTDSVQYEKINVQVIYQYHSNWYISENNIIENTSWLRTYPYKILGVLDDISKTYELSSDLIAIPGIGEVYVCQILELLTTNSAYESVKEIEKIIFQDDNNGDDNDNDDNPEPFLSPSQDLVGSF